MAAGRDNEGGGRAATLTIVALLAVLGLSRRGPLRLGTMLLVPGATGALGRSRAFAAIHPAVAVGIATAIGVLAVVHLALLSVLRLPMLRVSAGALLAVALVLRMVHALMLPLLGLRRLGSGGRGESECRRSGDENGLHVIDS